MAEYFEWIIITMRWFIDHLIFNNKSFFFIIISRQVYLLPQVCVVLQFLFAVSFYFSSWVFVQMMTTIVDHKGLLQLLPSYLALFSVLQDSVVVAV